MLASTSNYFIHRKYITEKVRMNNILSANVKNNSKSDIPVFTAKTYSFFFTGFNVTLTSGVIWCLKTLTVEENPKRTPG